MSFINAVPITTKNQLVFFAFFHPQKLRKCYQLLSLSKYSRRVSFYAKILFYTFDFWKDFYPLDSLHFACTELDDFRQLNSTDLATL